MNIEVDTLRKAGALKFSKTLASASVLSSARKSIRANVELFEGGPAKFHRVSYSVMATGMATRTYDSLIYALEIYNSIRIGG